MLTPWKKSYDKPRQDIKKQRHHFADKGPYSQSIVFFSSHIQMWKLDHKESWTSKNWCFQTVVLKKTLESSLDYEIKPINPKGNQSWIFTGRTNAKAEAPILWPPDVENWLIAKDPDAEKDRRQEGEGDDRGWDGWVASPAQWTWVWANSWRWWRTEKPGMLQFMGSQSVRHDWATELNWKETSYQTTKIEWKRKWISEDERSQYEKTAYYDSNDMTFWKRQSYKKSE